MRTAAGKVVLWDKATGIQGEYWPIDARALVAADSHVAAPPDGASVKAPVMPPARVGVPVPAPATLPVVEEPSAPPADAAPMRDVASEEPVPKRRRTPPQAG